MDCIEACTHDAIGYRLRTKKSTASPKEAENKKEQPATADTSRRAFMTASAMITGSSLLRSQEKKVDGGLAVILDKKAPKRTNPIVPPGAISLKNIAEHCTGCQLCVSACPNNVLRPSSNLLTLMQPESSYERGYCRPECTRCSQVCPAGAIVKISRAEKSSIQIGRAVWIKDNCLPVLYGTECGNCARHCPSGAIQMVNMDPNNPESQKIPVVNTERCIGCGACENLCPARPFSAIYVEGIEVHRTI